MFTSGFLYISLNSAICRACSASWASLAPCARASQHFLHVAVEEVGHEGW